MKFLLTMHELCGYTLYAVDGEIGRVKALFFDDLSWAVRYLMVVSGNWLGGRPVLVSPIAVGEICEDKRTICIELTREQIANTPTINVHMPISRGYEKAYYSYFNWPPYWEHDPSSDLTRFYMQPESGRLTAKSNLIRSDRTLLHSTHSFSGCKIAAGNAIVGHLEYIVVDMQYWLIRYLGIDASGLLANKSVLINQAWIEGVNWVQRTINIDLSHDAIKNAPVFDPSKPVNRIYEAELFDYHGRRPYWS